MFRDQPSSAPYLKRPNPGFFDAHQTKKQRIDLKEEPTNLLFGIFDPETTPTRLRPKPDHRLDRLENHPERYSVCTLFSLLDKAEVDEERNLIAVRFLLTDAHQLIFGLEGVPGGETPAHFQLSNLVRYEASCITAGDAFFDKNHRLCRINHKSGDFRPSFHSLQFVLPLLLTEKIDLAEVLMIEELNDKGGLIEIHCIDTSLIKTHYKPTPDHTLLRR